MVNRPDDRLLDDWEESYLTCLGIDRQISTIWGSSDYWRCRWWFRAQPSTGPRWSGERLRDDPRQPDASPPPRHATLNDRTYRRSAGPRGRPDSCTISPPAAEKPERVDVTDPVATSSNAGTRWAGRRAWPCRPYAAFGPSTGDPGPDGQIPVRVYRSHRTVGRVPAIVYYHGGGWVVGDLDSHDGSCRMLAKHSGCVVVSVDYRRAPEAPSHCLCRTAWLRSGTSTTTRSSTR